MISAYNFDDYYRFSRKDGQFEEYVEATTLATANYDIFEYIHNYLNQNKCCPDTVDLLQTVMANEKLLSKTHVVNDGSYRNCVILVRPDGPVLFAANHKSLNQKYDDWEQFYLDNAETLFLNMSERTWAEIDEWDRELNAEIFRVYEHKYKYGYGE